MRAPGGNVARETRTSGRSGTTIGWPVTVLFVRKTGVTCTLGASAARATDNASTNPARSAMYFMKTSSMVRSRPRTDPVCNKGLALLIQRQRFHAIISENPLPDRRVGGGVAKTQKRIGGVELAALARVVVSASVRRHNRENVDESCRLLRKRSAKRAQIRRRAGSHLCA